MSQLRTVDRWQMFTLSDGTPVYTNGRFGYVIGRQKNHDIHVTSLGETAESISRYAERVEKKIGVPVEWRFMGKSEAIFL